MLFSKQKSLLDTPFLGSLLDSQDTGIIVTGKDCSVLLMNTVAREHLAPGLSESSCRNGYSAMFPGLCEQCPNKSANRLKKPLDRDIKDKKENYYSVRYSSIDWVDGKPATAMFLRDVNEERTSNEKLFNLAYIDQLTGVANRRKLKEDFDEIAESIANSECTGMLVIFDLDNFKRINDTYGHGTGDIMLKRLTSFMEHENAFSGHLYRLGGDEFVLLYNEPSDRFGSLGECMEYYLEILQVALRPYTLPNIEGSSTLSIGASFFPWHGDNFSELLRKADIALYKAKENGRNRICFYEEIFDIAKKFKDIFINIQPILTSEGSTYGYKMVDQSTTDEEEDSAMNLNDFDRTMEAMGLDDLEHDMLYFIPYSHQLLNHSVAKHLPKNKFVVDIQVPKKCTEKEIKKYRDLHTLGYPLSFSGIQKSNALPELFELAYYCQFDPGETDEGFQRKIITQNAVIKFVATGVDTHAQLQQAKHQGHTLFLGFFFKQPHIIKKAKEIDPLKINYMRLLELTSSENYVDFKQISSIISSDVALSYKLLRLLNSVALGLRNPVTSIPMAIAYLGEASLKKWIAMLALRGIANDKPRELIRLSLIRAKFGEKIYEAISPKREDMYVFLLGLLSLLDVALDVSKEDIFKEIIVAEEIKISLLTTDGPHSDLVTFFSDYEYGNWDEVTEFLGKNNLTDDQANSAYIESVKWYNDLLSHDL